MKKYILLLSSLLFSYNLFGAALPTPAIPEIKEGPPYLETLKEGFINFFPNPTDFVEALQPFLDEHDLARNEFDKLFKSQEEGFKRRLTTQVMAKIEKIQDRMDVIQDNLRRIEMRAYLNWKNAVHGVKGYTNWLKLPYEERAARLEAQRLQTNKVLQNLVDRENQRIETAIKETTSKSLHAKAQKAIAEKIHTAQEQLSPHAANIVADYLIEKEPTFRQYPLKSTGNKIEKK